MEEVSRTELPNHNVIATAEERAKKSRARPFHMVCVGGVFSARCAVGGTGVSREAGGEASRVCGSRR